MPAPLFGKLALVTGAGSGIGRATSQILARDGAKIIAVDRNLSAAQETVDIIGQSHIPFEMDVASSDNIKKVIDQVLTQFKRPPTVVVNSAGITKDNFLLKMSEADFDSVIKVNLKGTFLVMQYFSKAMIDYKVGGSIINLASIVGRTGNIGQANYAASKAGVDAMTRVASKELAKFNIRVNAVLPGFITSPMTEIVPEKVKEMMIKICAMKRFGNPEEVGEVISFLASDKCSYVNGASIEVTGG